MQLLEPGNIDLTKRPRVKNPDGTISTVRSISINQDGKEILIPTVAEDGSRILSNDEAVEQFRRTGHHLGKFDSIESANKYAEQLHNSEAKKIMPIKIRGQNGIYEMPWNKPGEPSSQDIDAFLSKVEPPSSVAPKAKSETGPSLWERANTPLTTAPSRLANRISTAETTPRLSDKTGVMNAITDPMHSAEVKGFAGGAMEGAGNLVSSLTSPVNLGLTALSLGSGTFGRIAAKSAAENLAELGTAMRAARTTDEAAKIAPAINKIRSVRDAAQATSGTLGAIERGGMGAIAGEAGYKGIRDRDLSQAGPFAMGVLGMRSHGPVVNPRMGFEDVGELTAADKRLDEIRGRDFSRQFAQRPTFPTESITTLKNGVMTPQNVSTTPKASFEVNRPSYPSGTGAITPPNIDLPNSTISPDVTSSFGRGTATPATNTGTFRAVKPTTTGPMNKVDLANAEMVKTALTLPSKPQIEIDPAKPAEVKLKNVNEDTVRDLVNNGYQPGKANLDGSVTFHRENPEIRPVQNITRKPQGESELSAPPNLKSPEFGNVKDIQGRDLGTTDQKLPIETTRPNEKVNQETGEITELPKSNINDLGIDISKENKELVDKMPEDALKDFIERNTKNSNYDSPTGKNLLDYANSVLENKINNPTISINKELPKEPPATNLTIEDKANIESWYKFKKIYDSGKMTASQMQQWSDIHNKVKDLKPNGSFEISPYKFETPPSEEPEFTSYILPDGKKVMLSTSATKGAEKTTFQLKNGEIVEATKDSEIKPITHIKGITGKFGNERGSVLLESSPKSIVPKGTKPVQPSFKNPFDLLSATRSFMAGPDLSMPLRQGSFMVTRPQFWKSLEPMMRGAGSEKYFQSAMKGMEQDRNFSKARDAGLKLTGLDDMNNREESIISSLPERIPLLGKAYRGSNRAATLFINKLRFDTFKLTTEGIKDPETIKALANYINNATGRGDLKAKFGGYQIAGKELPSKNYDFEGAATALNTLFFSPRFAASRMRLLSPGYYIKMNPVARKEALRDLVGSVLVLNSVLGLGKLAGAKVGTDPTSSDFGKMLIGNTRIDFTGGFGPYIRLAAQLARNQKTSSITQKTTKFNTGKFGAPTKMDAVTQFLQSKEAPVTSFLTDYLKGKEQSGDPFELKKAVTERFTPMILQDMYDIIKEDPKKLGLAIPGVFGAGVQTYGKRSVKRSPTSLPRLPKMPSIH